MMLDSLGMFDAASALPEQISAAAEGARRVDGPYPHHDDIENVVVIGMGGSGMAGDVVREIAGPFMPVPVVVHKGYGIPNFVSDSSLVFVVSFSGNTEETIEAAQEAAAAGGRLVVVTAGGRLGELAASWDVAHLPIGDGIPMPRAGIGAVSIPPLIVLEQLGLFPGATAWIDAAVGQLTRRRDQLINADSVAEQLARRIGNQFPLVYGGGGMGATAALRWKNQFNENAKIPSFCNEVPELMHNEVCGWAQHGDVTRQVFRLLELRHDFEHPQVERRFSLLADLVGEVVSEVESVRAEGDGPLAQLLDLVLLGDFTSLHVAAQHGVDPGPVPVLDDIKAALARPA